MAMAKPKTKKFLDTFYVKAYRLAAGGMNRKEIGDKLNVTGKCIELWMLRNPAFRDAIKQGEKVAKRTINNELCDYILGKLTPEQKAVYDDLDRINKERNSIRKLDELFRNKGENLRKHLFLYTLLRTNYNVSKACAKVGINPSTAKRWAEQDIKFANLVDSIQEHKGDFFEEALVKLVKDGDSKTIMFVNKTFNKKRGYGEKLEVEHTGEIKHDHSHTIQLSEQLMDLLPLSARREVYKAAKVIEAKNNNTKEVPLLTHKEQE